MFLFVCLFVLTVCGLFSCRCPKCIDWAKSMINKECVKAVWWVVSDWCGCSTCVCIWNVLSTVAPVHSMQLHGASSSLGVFSCACCCWLQAVLWGDTDHHFILQVVFWKIRSANLSPMGMLMCSSLCGWAFQLPQGCWVLCPLNASIFPGEMYT